MGANKLEPVSHPLTTATALSRLFSTSTRRSSPVSSPFVRRHLGTRTCCLVRNETSVAPKTNSERHDSLSTYRYIRRFETIIADNSLLRRSVTYAQFYARMDTILKIRGQCGSAAQVPDSSNDIAPAETFQQVFVEKRKQSIRAIHSRVRTNPNTA